MPIYVYLLVLYTVLYTIYTQLLKISTYIFKIISNVHKSSRNNMMNLYVPTSQPQESYFAKLTSSVLPLFFFLPDILKKISDIVSFLM